MLKIENFPSYLSPSSLNTIEKMPNTIYVTRFMADPLPREPQGIGASIGSAFDYYIKEDLFKTKFPEKKDLLPLLQKSVETNKELAWSTAKNIISIYKELAYERDRFADVELRRTIVLKGIPITGYLDASYKCGLPNIPQVPFDWKVMGAGSNSGASPKKGFKSLIDGFNIKPPHKNWYEKIKIDEIDEAWAVQACTYGWLLDIPFGEEFPVYFDAIIVRPKGIRIAKYKALVDRRLQEQVYNKYYETWESLHNGVYLSRLASQTNIKIIWWYSLSESWF